MRINLRISLNYNRATDETSYYSMSFLHMQNVLMSFDMKTSNRRKG